MVAINQNLFDLPQPKLIREAKARSRKPFCVSMGKRNIKKSKPSLTRPKFIPHECKNESNCEICRSFINGKK